MTTTTTAPAKAETEFPQVCRDCGEVMELIAQPRWNGGYITLVTCWTRDCGLHGVTLSPAQYNALSETELNGYRKVNGKGAA